MDATLNVNSSAVAFGDTSLTNNPRRRIFDWTRNANGIAVQNPKAVAYSLYAGQNLSLFSGTRTVTIDGTTRFDVKSMGLGVYRFTWNAGTAPGMRTQRALTFAATNVVITINNNSTATFTAGSGTPFAAVQAGDSVYIPLPTDPVSGPFNPANGGFWTVLSASNTVLNMSRSSGATFNAAAETVSVTNTVNGPMLAFSATGVQVADKVDITAGFSATTQRTYEINALTCNWFEIATVSPIPEETAVAPTAVGVAYYSAAKVFVRIETDQECAVFVNGSTTGIRVSPITAGSQESVGWFEILGPVWSLSATNRSQYPLNINVFTAE